MPLTHTALSLPSAPLPPYLSSLTCLYYLFPFSPRFCFEVATPEATFYMYAENEKLKDDWIGAIGRAIVRYSKAFTADEGYDS